MDLGDVNVPAQIIDAEVVETSAADDSHGAGAIYNAGTVESADAKDR